MSLRLACLAALVASLAAAPAARAALEDPLLVAQPALTDRALLGAEEAWTQSTGRGQVVAVLDTGAQLDHPDLRDRLWTNPGEIAGNGVDDDADGIVDDVHGANMLTGGGDVTDDAGHGTHVAGTVAAAAGNGAGGSGVAPDARVMVVKVLDGAGRGGAPALAAGIRYAVARGARILNASLNAAHRSPAVEAAVADAEAAGATIVASAGNDGADVGRAPSFPVALPAANVLGVAASTGDGALWAASNRGVGAVELSAPGEDVLSTALGGGYEQRSGTSMSAAHASGALALLAAARPDLGQPELRAALLDAARPAPGLRGAVAYGGLDVAAAMHRLLPGAAWRAPVRLRAPAGARAGRVTLRWSARHMPTVVRWRVTVDGRTVGRVRAGRPLRIRTRVGAGSHRWRVVALNGAQRRVAAEAGRFRALTGL
jgi:subtilisin family serine protease